MRRRASMVLAGLLLAGASLLWAAPSASAFTPICVTMNGPAGWTEEVQGPSNELYGRVFQYGAEDMSGPDGTRRAFEAAVGFEQGSYAAGGERYDTLETFLDEFEEKQQINEEVITVRGHGTATIGGKPAFYTSYTRSWYGYQMTNSGVGIKRTYADETKYFVDLGDSGVGVAATASVTYWGTESPDTHAAVTQLAQQAASTVRGATFDWDGCGAATPDAPAAELPWRTVAGGAAAVAAAATAIAGAAASATSKKAKLDPNKPVGHVLDLSSTSLDLTRGSAELVVQAWTVLASGQVRPEQATVTLNPPLGVALTTASGTTPLRTTVWQTGGVDPGAGLTVTAATAGGGTQSTIGIMAAAPARLVVMAGSPSLAPGGASMWVRAELEAPDTMATQDYEAARASITFDPPASSGWLDLGVPRDFPRGKDIPAAASTPDPNHQLTPPESVTVSARCQVGTQVFTGSVVIGVERPAVLDLRPDALTMGVGSREVVDVLTWVGEPGGVQWAFAARWREGDRPVAGVQVTQQTASSALVRVTEEAAKLPDIGVAEETSTLIVQASVPGREPLVRHLLVGVVREGLYVDAVGRDASGVFHLDATGTAKPTEIDVRVFVKDAAGQVAFDPKASEAVTWRPGGDDPSPGRAALCFPEFTLQGVGIRPSNRPSATFKLVMNRVVPTSGKPIAAVMDAAAGDGPAFNRSVPLSIDGVDMSPYSPAWQGEMDECLRIIERHAPRDRQADLKKMLYTRGPQVGAEAVHELRRRIWALSENALRAECADYLTKAWTYEQAESVLEWASWCGDIAFAVVSGKITGTAAGLAAGLLKPVLVSAMTAYLDGTGIEGWASQQVLLAVQVCEGQLTDPDFLQKVSGANKAKVWAVFTAYTFVKEWALDPNHSITEAATRTGQMLRDQALIHFLRRAAGTLPQGAPDDEADPQDPKKTAPTASKLPGTAKSRADAAAAKIRAGQLDAKGVMEILTDPDGMRVMKKDHPDAWKTYVEKRQQIYDTHDERLKAWIKENVPDAEGRTIEVEFFGTKSGVDRDYRAGYTYTDNTVTPPRKVFIEIPKEKWAPESQRIFAEQTGGPTDPAGAAKWAKEHQQLPTDGYHAEAAVDMTDQLRVWNPEKGAWEQQQVEPRVNAVEDGRGVLMDPEGLGKTYETKVAEAYHAGAQLDAYTQAGKAVHTLEAVRDGYAQQGYGVKDLPPNLQAGVDVIKAVGRGDLTPDAAEAQLRGLKLGGLPDLMERVSGSFGSLKWARKG